MSASHLAKLSPPRTAPAAPRPELFRRLDAAEGVAFVHGPPGAGKTTVVAEWLSSRGHRAFWYHVDPGDADVASFFHHLALVARTRRRTASRLPAFTAEYRESLSLFARRFFRGLVTELKPPFVLVFDDLHEIAAESDVAEALRAGLEELPRGARAVLVGRAPPPPAHVRLVANGAIDVIGPDSLLLTPAEARSVAALRGAPSLSREQVEDAVARCCGWVAGLVLLLAGASQSVAGSSVAEQAVFDYLTNEILDRLDPEMRRLVLELSLLPRATEQLSEAATGSARAPELLGALARRGWFVDRKGASYEFHPLMRETLLRRAKRDVPDERAAEVRRVAALNLQHESPDDAIDLLAQAGDWGGVARLALEHAPGLLTEGRFATLERWLSSIPEPVRDQAPWAWYWLGMARLGVSPAAARVHLERAFELFERARDATGVCLAWAAAVDGYVWEWGDFTPLDGWLEAFDRVRPLASTATSPEAGARVAVSMFAALMMHRPHDPELPVWLERARALALGPAPGPLRLRLGTFIILYLGTWMGDTRRAGEIVDALAPLASEPDVDPLTGIIWRTGEAPLRVFTGAVRRCKELVHEADVLADGSGVHAWDFVIRQQALLAALVEDDLEAARDALARMKAVLRRDAPLNEFVFEFSRGLVALRVGDAQGALAAGRRAKEGAVLFGLPFCELWGSLVVARALALGGRRDDEEVALAAARQLVARTGSAHGAHVVALCEALGALRGGHRERARDALRAAFSSARGTWFADSWFSPSEMAELLSFALVERVEPEAATSLARGRRSVPVPPDALCLEEWPWPLRIRTLGGLTIERDGQDVALTPGDRRACDLLEAIVALGGGEEVEAERLEESLWPDADGDQAHHALETALWRLRRLLAVDGAVYSRGGRIGLDAHRCFVDALALDRIAARAGSMRRREGDEYESLSARMETLHRGPFVPGSRNAWSAAFRERLEARVRRARAGRPA